MAHGVVLLFQLVLVLFVCRALSVSAVLQAFLPKINFIYGVVACLHPLSLYQSLCLPALVHAAGQFSTDATVVKPVDQQLLTAGSHAHSTTTNHRRITYLKSWLLIHSVPSVHSLSPIPPLLFHFSPSFLSCSFYAVARPSVCLSVVCLSVTLVHPTQAVVTFGNISTAFGTLAIR